MNTFIFDRFHAIGVIPVLEIDSAAHAVPTAEALSAGGLPIAEVTLRTEAGLDSIRNIARSLPDTLVGAGTVVNLKQAQEARDAGAQFLVSPGMAEDVVLWAQKNTIPILAGAVTPTEIMRGLNLGLTLFKFFPSETMGGLKAIQAVSDPFPQVRFIPTGGVRFENLADYLRMEKVHAVGGSWMAKRSLIAEGRFDEIRRLAEEARRLVETQRQSLE
ncbi:MAG: bifunctional 4-hydroxy-2-oxoglutarate aldolase/2-dehydro-3-deoxy-phosphogluconate aldolase [Chloroflexi bacterium]|nr:bifunctional 4-hydroxy-2-oxoglutarate aldolase/2-dehydro-3-deoxy-phosphogluconate aldolase [Chloroflexota bacterium]MCA2001345.1 bifunctional 4-hydroxy-2-oxoglutarate aldolase/2-dehydro-3-deoxy-phosphogluconate aldolase [Chloroflexota bacterium]